MITTKKMDSTRDTKKGISRFAKQSALGKSKLSKGKIRKLSSVRREKPNLDDNEMGCRGVSNGEDEFNNIVSGKKHKMPRKCLDDRKAVDHSSVPRKLRSAMKKRTSKSLFPPLPRSKKLNHSDKKQQRSHQSPRENLSEAITKDEEEVVETLYLLAGMLSHNDTASRSRIQDDSSSAVDEVGESPTIMREDSKEAVPSSAAQNACISANEERSLLQFTYSSNQTESRTCQDMDYLTTTPYHENPDNTATVSPSTLLLGHAIGQSNAKLQNAASLGTSLEISNDAGLELPKENNDNSFNESKLENGKALDIFDGKELKQHHGNGDSEHHGSLLWPSLSPAASKDSGRPSLLQSSAVEVSSVPDATLCSVKLESAENGFPVAKVNKDAIHKMPWKRCAAHIYICRVIQALKSHEFNEAVEPNKIGQLEEPERGVYGQTNIRGLRNVGNGYSFNSGSNYGGGRECSVSRNSILPEKNQIQDQQLVYSARGEITSQNQSFDFLSLSTGSDGAKSSINGAELGAGSWFKGHSQSHVSPHLNSIKQQQTNVPQAMMQTHYSVAYNDQLSAASKQLQPALYPISSGYSMLHKGSSIPMMEHQYQQMLLAAELANRVKHVGYSNPVSQFPPVQNGRIETSNRIPYSQTVSPPYLAMHKVRGDSQMRQYQQQQLIPPTLMLSTVMRRPEHRKLSSHEGNYSSFHSSGTLPLQLLCDEPL